MGVNTGCVFSLADSSFFVFCFFWGEGWINFQVATSISPSPKTDSQDRKSLFGLAGKHTAHCKCEETRARRHADLQNISTYTAKKCTCECVCAFFSPPALVPPTTLHVV